MACGLLSTRTCGHAEVGSGFSRSHRASAVPVTLPIDLVRRSRPMPRGDDQDIRPRSGRNRARAKDGSFVSRVVQAAGPRFVKGLVYLGWGKVAALAGIRPPGVPGSPGYRQGTTRGHAGPAADCDAPSWSLPGTRAGGRAGPAESPRCSRTESRSAWCPDGRSWSETLSGGWAVREALLWNLGITTFLSRPASE